MPQKRLTLNEIRSRALAFSKEWDDATDENAEAKPFWEAFFRIFGLTRRHLAAFEKRVKKNDGSRGYIDLLWPGVVLIEHKSRGFDLDKAYKQSREYIAGLKDRELPQYIILCDFDRFRVYNIDADKLHKFKLNELPDKIGLFGFISGYEKKDFGEQDPVNIKAAEKMGALHDALAESNYDGHDLEVLLVRLLFCLFAEDAGIFDIKSQFQAYIQDFTREDGSDLGMHLEKLFEVLNTPEDKRSRSLNETLAEFPYINGSLFAERLGIADFTSAMRELLLDCCGIDWATISPAIFGALFQSVMDKTARRALGAHYTTEANILKAIRPLFLDDLEEELGKVLNDKSSRRKGRLIAFQDKLANIRIFDPACGCGNFLVIAYRSLRELELRVIETLHASRKKTSTVMDVGLVMTPGKAGGLSL